MRNTAADYTSEKQTLIGGFRWDDKLRRCKINTGDDLQKTLRYPFENAMHKDRTFSSFGENKKNGYRLSKQIFEFTKTHNDRLRPGHIALYFWICELNNKLGWGQDVIGLPTMEAMKMIGIRDRRFYRRILTELNDLGLIRIVKSSPNQYVATQVKILLHESHHHSYEDRVSSTEHDDSRYQYDKKTGNALFRMDDDSPLMEVLPDDD